FLITKKDKGLHLINNTQKINKIILKDTNPLLNYKEFNKAFKNYKIISLLDLFSKYNQIPFEEVNRNITTFTTPLNLFQITTLPQGSTNSITQFIKTIIRIFYNLILNIY
ncbi:hypothetical protein QBC45DRAFT_334442, partial [Copromyces sp. CBS 386.78]